MCWVGGGDASGGNPSRLSQWGKKPRNSSWVTMWTWTPKNSGFQHFVKQLYKKIFYFDRASQGTFWRFARDWRHHRRYLEASIIPVGFCTGDLPPIQNTSCQYYPAKPLGGGQRDALHWVFCQVGLLSSWNWQTFPIWVWTNLTAYNCTVFNPTSPKHLFFVTSTLCSGSVKVSLRCKTAWQARFSNCNDFIVIFSVTPEDSNNVV